MHNDSRGNERGAQSRPRVPVSPVVAAARAFTVAAHGQQRYGAQPFVVHLDEVASLLQPFGQAAQIAGYPHDVVEDTPVQPSDIAAPP